MFFNDCTKDGNTTCVTVLHNGELYKGYSHCHPDDRFNGVRGGRIAEARATINALKAERRAKIAECEACRAFVNSVTSHKDFDTTSPEAKFMYHQLNMRYKAVNKITDEINSLLLSIEVMKKGIDKVNKFIENKEK